MLSSDCRVLVTGACGSIGSAIINKLLINGNTVCAFDQSEDGLFKLDSTHKGNNLLKLFIGSVRDEKRLNRSMEGVDVVFHCAALKHVYLSEYNPFEAVGTNIYGVNNVISAALHNNVKKVVFTSSDKAVNPTSTMGTTKLLGERLISSANNFHGKHKTIFSSVRFGNVLNTNGSVLQIFKEQIKSNQPLTITSKDMTRFFISLQGAVDLCFEAVNEMVGGEIFVKSMGSCSIISLAKAYNTNTLFDYKIVGLKPGEKLYEELVTEQEAVRTVKVDNTYIILPETIDYLPDELQSQYHSKFKNSTKIKKAVRSDDTLLNDDDVKSMLKNYDII